MAVSKKTQDSISVSSSGSTTSSHLDRAAEIRRDQKHVDEQKAKEITERAGIRSQNAVDTRSKTINAAAEFAVGHNEHVDEVLANFRAGNLPTPDKSTPMFRRGSGSKSPKGKEYTSVSTIVYDDPTPLSTNANLVKKWLDDESTWKDVYSRKPLEYLEAISRGESSKWDEVQGKYIYLNTANAEASFGGETVAKMQQLKKAKWLLMMITMMMNYHFN